jgi:acyl-CoA hydrolase
MLTVSMNRVTFKKPLFPTDVVEMRSRVVYLAKQYKKNLKFIIKSDCL